MNDFSSIPVLDLSLLSSPDTRHKFVEQLRHALINVGFLYLSNHTVSADIVSSVVDYIPKLFALPQEAKDKIRMANSEHFLGYSKLGAELTRGQVDYREQFDFATRHTSRWREGDPDYYRLWGESQWPDEDLIPGFHKTFETYLDQVRDLSDRFSSLISEALGLGPNGLSKFYDEDRLMQHRSKIVKYPIPPPGALDQGVGPHYDAGFSTFLLQASDHRGLQVQNLAGEWVDAPPIPGTFVINFGKALEFVTGGLARATSHRVLSPKGGTPRYSVPFFQNISLTICLSDEVLDSILKLRDARGTIANTDSVNFSEFNKEPSGKVNLIGRIKSHPDVGERHYPELFKEIFPSGFSGKGTTY